MVDNSRNEIRDVLQLAEQFGAELPKRVGRTAQHALDLDLPAPVPVNSIADSLLEKLGDLKGFDAALPDALDEIARADAMLKLSRELSARATRKAQQMMRQEAEPIVAAFAKAMQPSVDVLNKMACTLPETFSTNEVNDLTTEQFAAWKSCEPAAAQLEAAAFALRWLFGVKPDDTTISLVIAHRLPFVEPPETMEYPDAFPVLNAIGGIRHIGGTLSPANQDRATFWPARVVHSGAEFKIATPTDARERAERLRTACIQPRKPRSTPSQRVSELKVALKK